MKMLVAKLRVACLGHFKMFPSTSTMLDFVLPSPVCLVRHTNSPFTTNSYLRECAPSPFLDFSNSKRASVSHERKRKYEDFFRASHCGEPTLARESGHDQSSACHAIHRVLLPAHMELFHDPKIFGVY